VVRETEICDDAEGDECGGGEEVECFGESQCGRDAVARGEAEEAQSLVVLGV